MIQPPPPEPVQLEEIVVTGARLPMAAGEAAFAVIQLDPGAVTRPARIDEVLASVPSVGLFRRTGSLGANPTTQGVSLRAIAPSGAGRALVTLDGVPLNDPFGGWVIWSQTPPEAVDSLDVVRGAGAGPWGAGALTGVIALRERDREGVLDLSAGQDGGARAAVWIGHDFGPLFLSASGLHDRSDGYVPVRGSAAGAADRPLALDARSGSLRADFRFGGRGMVSLRGGAWREDRGSGLDGAESAASGSVVSLTAVQSPEGDVFGWRLQAWRRESDLFNTSVAVAPGRATTTPASSQDETPAVGHGINAALRRTIGLRGGRLQWELGLDWRSFEGETRERFRYMAGAFTRSRIAGGEQTVAGAYGEASWTSGPWLVAGGLRLDRWESRDGRRRETDLATALPTLDERAPDRSGEVFTGRLGLRRGLGEGLAVRVAAYAGFRPPTLNELHRPFRVGNDLTEANATLEPERLTGVEAGLAGEAGFWTWGVTAFWNQVDDAVVNVTIGEGPGTFPRAGFVPAGGVLRQRMNAGAIEAVGLEAEANRRFGPVAVTLAASVTDAEMDGGDRVPQLTGLRPAQAAPWSAVAELDWAATDRLRLAARLRWEGRRFDDDLNRRVLEAGGVLDLRGEWAANDRVVLWAAADNVLDAEVEVSETADGVSGYGSPRTVRLGLRLAF